jgi:class 3 adenylate cyclase
VIDPASLDGIFIRFISGTLWFNSGMPSGNTEQRKLAAIMFTDMVGYSALSQRDEALAQELLEEHRQLLRCIFSRFNGIEIKTIGDAFLVEFSSALEAAQSAIEIQRALAKRNHDVTPDRRIELKIGIHIGDVVHRGEDVYGDGVNIASRIEPLAGAGGICVSMDVERQIRNALEARFERLAPTQLKNIKVPMELFRIVLPWETGAKPDERVGRSSKRVRIVGTALAALLVLALTGWWLIQRSGKDSKPVGNSGNTPAASAATAESMTPAPTSAPPASVSTVGIEALFCSWMQNAEFTSFFHEKTDAGLFAVRIEGRLHDSAQEYRASFVKKPVENFYRWAFWGQSSYNYERINSRLTAAGYDILSQQTFEGVIGEKRYQTVWVRRDQLPAAKECLKRIAH